MITEKDFTYVGLSYVNLSLTYDPDYVKTDMTFNNGGCPLPKLKNGLRRFMTSIFYGVSTEELTLKRLNEKVVKLTCSKAKLLELPSEGLVDLKSRLIDWLNARKFNVQDVFIYAI